MRSQYFATGLAVYGSQWSPDRTLAGIEAVTQMWSRMRLPPHAVCLWREGKKSTFGSVKSRERIIRESKGEAILSYSWSRLRDGSRHYTFGWEAYASLSPKSGDLELLWLEQMGPQVELAIEQAFHHVCVISEGSYGYRFRQESRLGPAYYTAGVGVGLERRDLPIDYCYNISWWRSGDDLLERRIRSGILRDIYPESYLSESHLSAPIGRSRTTLREWIREQPSIRGTLEPFTDILTKWTPPVNQIPQIREELYRAGRVFYWKFVCSVQGVPGGGTIPEPLYRPDLAAPWEAPDPIPEIYTADFYKGRDPSLTL
jgi:hypothetical protein